MSSGAETVNEAMFRQSVLYRLDRIIELLARDPAPPALDRASPAHDWERIGIGLSRCRKCGWGWKVELDNGFPCPGFDMTPHFPAPPALDREEGIVQRAHIACCWCGEHHEEGR